MRWDVSVTLRHAFLEDDSTLNRIDDAAELGQKAVAHQLEDAAIVLFDLRLEQFLAVRAQAREGACLILLHKAAVPDHVRGEDCCEPAFHCRLPRRLRRSDRRNPRAKTIR